MTEHDLVEVCAIEEVSELSAWGWDAYHNELHSRTDTIMLVARHDSKSCEDQIAGFIGARIFADELHVNNVAVRPEFRGRDLVAPSCKRRSIKRDNDRRRLRNWRFGLRITRRKSFMNDAGLKL